MRPRKITEQLEKAIEKPVKKVIFLWGARQVGKSTILNHLYQKYGGSWFNFDDLEDQRLFVPELSKLEASIAFKKNKPKSSYIFIDEIQKYPESTQSVKLLADSGNYTIIATGSSELKAKTNMFDTLAGRYREFVLFPLTIDEIAAFHDKKVKFETAPDFAQSRFFNRYLEEMLIFGSYPGVILAKDKIDELKIIVQNSVIKDIVNIYDLKNNDLVYNLLRLLAMQIGNLVNISELSSALGAAKSTISNYLSILTKNRIIFFLEPFRTNKRRAYLERKKVFFVDLGVRNSLVEDFRPIHFRQDFGAVFENLIIAGILRQNFYQKNNNKLFYLREIGGGQKEIDLIKETPEGKKDGFEIKYSGGQIHKFPKIDIGQYRLISSENAASFLV